MHMTTLPGVRALALALLSTVALAGDLPAANGLPYRFPDVMPPVDDASLSLLSSSLHLRIIHDRPALLAKNAELVAGGLDDPWAIFCVARNAGDVMSRSQALATIANRDLAAFTGGEATTVDLDPDAWLFMQATIDWLGNRYASAEAVLADLARRHPDWGPALAYVRWRCLGARLAPIAERQALLDTLATDGTALTMLFFGLSSEVEAREDLQRIRALLDQRPETAELRALSDFFALKLTWLDKPPTARDLEEQWRGLAAAHGDEADTYISDLSYEIAVRISGQESVGLLGKLSRSRPGTSFALRQIEELLLAGHELKAQDLMARRNSTSGLDLVLKLKLAQRLSSADAQREAIEQIRDERIATSNTVEIHTACMWLGREETWAGIWEELGRENIAAAIDHRLDQMTMDRIPRLLALRDSLLSLDLDTRTLRSSFDHLEAATRETVDLQAIAAETDPLEQRELFSLAHATAMARGDHQLRNELVRMEVELTDNPAVIRSRAFDGVIAGDRELAELALARLDDLGEEPTDGLQFRILARSVLGGDEAGKAALASVNPNTINGVGTLVDLANLCIQMEMLEKLGAVRQRLEILAPESGSTLMTAAVDEQLRGEFGTAVTIFRRLAAEYPGDQWIQSKLLEFGDSVVALDDLAPDLLDNEDLFAPLGEDLSDLEGVLDRRIAVSDSIQDDAVSLLYKRSIVLSGLSDSYERIRNITQVLTRPGAEAWRSFSFTFDPGKGVPHVRAARVFTPDGKVLETDPSTILVRAPEEEGTDVSDAREMVVPLRGVEPGAIVDVVYDQHRTSNLSESWSMFEFFIGDDPVREYVLELHTPASLQVRSVVHGPITAEPVDPDSRVQRWRIRDLATAKEENYRPAINEVVPWVGLTTARGWAEIGEEYSKAFWQTAVPSDRVAAVADSLVATAGGKTEKAAALYRFVREEITPLAVELGAGRYWPSSCDEVLDRGWGDCKDVSNLLIALLAAEGIDARPVLVSTLGHLNPREDLPALAFFNHMIVQITGIGGDPYCDPLNGTECLEPLPVVSAGRLGLHIDPDGSSELTRLPLPDPEDNVTALEVDIRPVGEQFLHYEIQARYRGEVARYMRQFTSYGDTNVTRALLDRAVGYGVPGGVPIESWSTTEGDCGVLEVTMSYLDSTWAEEGASSAVLHHANEGPVYWELPVSKDRLYDVEFPAGYTSTLILRLHGNEVWTPDKRVVPFKVKNDYFEGAIEGKTDKEDDNLVVTIDHDFELRKRAIPRADYKKFRQDAVAFAMFSAQRHDYRRVLDENLIEEMETYAQQYPEDQGFRLNAAQNLLGSDLGGLGEEGETRRKVALDLLAPLVAGDSPNTLAALLVAAVHMNQNQYGKAVEVVEAAQQATDENLYLLSTLAAAYSELERWDLAAEHLATLANRLGSPAVVERYAMALLMMDDEENARAQFERMRLMGSPMSEERELMLRAGIAESKDDLPQLKAAVARLEELGEDEQLIDLYRCAVQSQERRTSESIPILEAMLAEDPSNSHICNNLAWSYALCGQNLDRALMLSQVATLLSDDPASSRNTYGAVLARMGKWKEAREVFRELYENDDRPTERKVNGYFLGLAEARLGHEDRARELWHDVVDLPANPRWSRMIRESLTALDEGGDITGPVFEG